MPITARSYLGLLVLGLGTLVAPLDSAVNIAFPRITGDFGVPLADIRWVIVCYVLTHTSLMLVFGKLGDLFGHKRIFTAGLALSVLTFTLCAIAWRFEWLLAFRVSQGVSAALVLSCGPALATSLFPEAYRGRVLGAYLMMFGIGGALGPSLGGLLVAEWGWQAVFWFRAPIAFAALLLVFVLPTPPRRDADAPFDTLGAILIAAAMSGFLLTVTQLQRLEEHPLAVALLAVAALAAIVVYTRRAARHPSPVLRLAVFRRIDFTVLNLANVAVNFTGFAVLLLVPYFLARLSGLDVGIGGFVLAMSPLGVVLASPVAGWSIGPVPANRVAFIGVLLVSGGTFIVGQWDGTPGILAMTLPLLMSGLGLGLFQVAYMNIVTGTLPIADRGVAGSLALLTRTIGIVGAASLLTWMFAAFEAGAARAGLEPRDAFLDGFQSTFGFASAFLLVFLLASLLRPGTWFGRPTEGPDT
jgi:hypothetical protein